MIIFDELLQRNRLLSVLYENLPREIQDSDLYKSLVDYFESYVRFNGTDAETASNVYQHFIAAYSRHSKEFIKTGAYPLLIGDHALTLSRNEYDLVLLLSTLFTEHRFKIMQLIHDRSQKDQRALGIGVGPGLELFLTKKHFNEVDAYDLSISEFLYHSFPNVSFYRELYKGQKREHYNAVYLIEILEHLEDPYELIRSSYSSLAKNGKVYLTTATNIPQFDHLYNFPLDHSQFEMEVKETGFAIDYTEAIQHNYLSLPLRPSNRFYILRKL